MPEPRAARPVRIYTPPDPECRPSTAGPSGSHRVWCAFFLPTHPESASEMLKAAALLVLASVVSVLAGEKSAGCGKTPTITSKVYTMTVNGKQRQYYVKVPQGYNKATPHRLVFSWHQRGASMQKNINGEDTNHGGALPIYGLPPQANETANNNTPNDNNSNKSKTDNEEETFFDQMVKVVEADLCVD